ncbi:MAG: archaetidylserine decarboxylase [Verrucomicrobiota bacterium]|nr:archaetidylserine decarboxylase [Verrucomicrobiota bacterium]
MPHLKKYDIPISYYNRANGMIEEESVYGERFLRWAYGNCLGRLTVALAVKRLWFSCWYGWRMNRPKSRSKIAPFISDYSLKTEDFAASVDSYASFNEFFYRQLKKSARPVVQEDKLVCFPADGRHLAISDISISDSFYIKGQYFNVSSFVEDSALASAYMGGAMLISRLCPVDYHRFHFPVSGQVSDCVLLSGSLRSVSPLALRRNLSILWENRRTRTVIKSEEFGEVLMFEVGATCVGGIHQTFSPGIVKKGEEKGFFSFGGSCVVTLFKKGTIQFDADLLKYSEQGMEVFALMGERCGMRYLG